MERTRFNAMIRQAGKSQIAVAREIGVLPSALSRWSSGGAMPGVAQLPALADALGVSIDAVVGALMEDRDLGVMGGASSADQVLPLQDQ